MSHDELDDLLIDVPRHVVPDAAAAWRAGRRRRARTSAGAALAVAVAILVLGLGLGALPRGSVVQPAAGGQGDGGGVAGYPQRIENPYEVDDLPDRPGPLAGLLDSGEERWLAVSATGHVWALPDAVPSPVGLPTAAISDDGTRVLYAAHHHYVLHDLLTGTVLRTVVRDTSIPRSPAFWSPSGVLAVVPGNRSSLASTIVGLDGTHASVAPQQAGVGTWFRAGWIDDTTLAWTSRVRDDGITLLETDLQGRTVRRVLLSGTAGGDPVAGGDPFDPWSARVSPDGSTVAVRTLTGVDAGTVTTYSTSTGDATGSSAVPGEQRCSPAWSGDDVRLPQTTDPDGGQGLSRHAVVLVDSSGSAQVAAYPGLDVTCSVWAADALAGSQHRGLGGRLFGTSELGFLWWWRETSLGLAGLLLAAVAGVWVRGRRRRRRLGSRPEGA